jgi:hypothetical protein
MHESDGGVPRLGRDWRKIEAVAAGSGGEFSRPGGAIRKGSRGEMERGRRAIYRRGESSKWSRSKENLRGELTGGEGSVTGGILGRRLKKASVLTRGPLLSVR